MTSKKENRGGARKGAGRKPKYGKSTVRSIRFPDDIWEALPKPRGEAVVKIVQANAEQSDSEKQDVCLNCHGTGRDTGHSDRCQVCNGAGKVPVKYPDGEGGYCVEFDVCDECGMG